MQESAIIVIQYINFRTSIRLKDSHERRDMGDKISLTLEPREVQGKKVAKLRKQGLVPAIVYGYNMTPTMAQTEYGVIEKVVREAGKHAPVHITIGGKRKVAMIKDIDRDPARSDILHVSFHAVKQSDPVVAEVGIHLIGEGESEAEKAGLVVLQSLEKIDIKALPANLPSALEVSIAGLSTTDDHITLADITLPEGVEYADAEQSLEQTVASVYEPSALQAANDAAGGDAVDESEVDSENGEAPAEAEDAEAKPGDKDAK